MEVDQIDITSQVPPMQGILSEVATFYQPYVEKLFNSNPLIILEGLKQIQNFVIGNNKQKTNFIVLRAIPRLVYLIQHQETNIETKIQCAIVLGSLAKGTEENVKSLLDYGVLNVMLLGLQQTDLRLYEACLRCIHSIAMFSQITGDLLLMNVTDISRIVSCMNQSVCTQQCTCDIINHCCKKKIHQDLLLSHEVVEPLAQLLTSPLVRIQLKALQAIAALCYKNLRVSESFLKAKCGESRALDVLTASLSRAQAEKIQLHAARCLVYIYRTNAMHEMDNKIISLKVLPCLVRMCSASSSIDERVTGGKTVAYLIEANPELQRLALICERFPAKLEAYFRHPVVADTQNADDMKRFKQELGRGDELVEAGFLAYAALLSNDEDMRKLVATSSLMRQLIDGMSDDSTEVRIAALQCTLSLSRSVQMLRTIFEDNEVWKPVLKIASQTWSPDDPVSMKECAAVSAVVCNLLLYFSPCRSPLLASDIVSTIKTWCECEKSIDVQRNGVWALFNVTYQADLDLKMQVMSKMGSDLFFALIASSHYDLLTKTLGVFNNVLINKAHTDAVMKEHGHIIMQACVIAIESVAEPAYDVPFYLYMECRDIRAHIRCFAVLVLLSVASGDGATTICKYFHDNDNMLRRLVEFMTAADVPLRTAAVKCVHALCCVEQAGVVERRAKFAHLSLPETLLSMKDTWEGSLYSKTKRLLEVFQPKSKQ